MKAKGFIITTVFYALLAIALRKLMMGEFDWRSVISAVVEALIFSSLIFTVGFKFFKKTQNKLVNSVIAIELTMDERLLLESPANHFKGVEAVGGKLFLTDKRLVFKSHKFNVQNHQQEFPLTQVNTVVQGKGMLGRVLEVTFANNEVDRFVVESPSRWIQMLQRQ